MKIRHITTDAVLTAMVIVLGFVSLNIANSLKLTFESVPVLIGACLFGPFDGFLIGTAGSFIYQLLSYGITVTTLLWVLPYSAAGLVMGLLGKRALTGGNRIQFTVSVFISEIVIMILNTLALYVDSKVGGYYNFEMIFGVLILKTVLCFVKSVIFSCVIPVIVRVLKEAAVAGNR